MKSALLATLAILAACGSPQPKPPTGSPGVAAAADRDDCTKDEDCTLVEACCGCAAGGRKVGLRLDALEAYEKGRTDRCKAVTCAAPAAGTPAHSSCNAESVCRKGHCRAQPHMNQGSAADLPPATTP